MSEEPVERLWTITSKQPLPLVPNGSHEEARHMSGERTPNIGVNYHMTCSRRKLELSIARACYSFCPFRKHPLMTSMRCIPTLSRRLKALENLPRQQCDYCLSAPSHSHQRSVPLPTPPTWGVKVSRCVPGELKKEWL